MTLAIAGILNNNSLDLLYRNYHIKSLKFINKVIEMPP